MNQLLPPKILKTLCVAIAAILGCAGILSAQTLKWSHQLPPGSVLARAGDGHGAVAVCLRSVGPTEESARCVWIGAHGEILLTHDLERAHEDGSVDIVRLTNTELAVRFSSSTQPNLLRRFKRTRQGIIILDKELEPFEEVPRAPEHLTDPFGFFSFGYNGAVFEIRRYRN